MRFGATKDEVIAAGGQGTVYIRYLKDGDTVVRLLQEPEGENSFVYYREHFLPGASAPCIKGMTDEECKGCIHPSEKVRSTAARAAFNVVEGDYVNVYSVPQNVFDKFWNRYDRIGTVTDRFYRISKYKTGSGDRARVNYDLDSMSHDEKLPPVDSYQLNDINELLTEKYNFAWNPDKPDAGSNGSNWQRITEVAKAPGFAQGQSEDPPSKPSSNAKDEGEVSELMLRRMNKDELIQFCVNQNVQLPMELLIKSEDQIVDWLIKQS